MTSLHNQYDNLSRRDYRLVEKNDTTKFRMPLSMRPVYGGIPTACRKWENGIFLPSEPFLTECYYCHHSFPNELTAAHSSFPNEELIINHIPLVRKRAGAESLYRSLGNERKRRGTLLLENKLFTFAFSLCPLRLLFLCGIVIFFSSCTAPIDLKTANSEPVIVIYGCLTEDTTFQTIRVSVSSPYFEMSPNMPVSDAIVSIQSSEDQIFELLETTEKGLYRTRFPMAAITGVTYNLSVQADIHRNGEMNLYEAETTMQRPFPIDSVGVRIMTIMGFKHYNITLYAQEEPDPDYYYAYSIINDTLISNRLSRSIVFSDYGMDGQYMDGLPLMQFEDSENEFFSNRDNMEDMPYNVVKQGDKITVCLSLIEKGYFDFIEQCQRERRGENPFFGGPASNITTNISNGGVGYFTAFCTTRVDVYVP